MATWISNYLPSVEWTVFMALLLAMAFQLYGFIAYSDFDSWRSLKGIRKLRVSPFTFSFIVSLLILVVYILSIMLGVISITVAFRSCCIVLIFLWIYYTQVYKQELLKTPMVLRAMWFPVLTILLTVALIGPSCIYDNREYRLVRNLPNCNLYIPDVLNLEIKNGIASAYHLSSSVSNCQTIGSILTFTSAEKNYKVDLDSCKQIK